MAQQTAFRPDNRLDSNQGLASRRFPSCTACLAYLFQHGYRVDEWNNLAILASHTASTSGDERCLQVLLDHGWDINSPEPHNEPPVMR